MHRHRRERVNLPPIESSRLELDWLSPAFLDNLLDGDRETARAMVAFAFPDWWPGEHARPFRMWAEQMRATPAAEGWLVRAMVLKGPERLAIGRIGFHGPPGTNGQQDPGAVELGYDVDPPYRRKGYASEAALALMSWAHAEHGIRRFLASVSPANAASLALVQKLGFVQAGTQWDEEDGEELVFELRR